MGVLLLLLSLLPPPDELPPPPPLLSFKGACRVVALAKGGVLACQVREGMSEAQVRALLGNRYRMHFLDKAAMDIYPDLMVAVFWSSPLEKGRRGKPPVVREVRYFWECWTEWGGER